MRNSDNFNNFSKKLTNKLNIEIIVSIIVFIIGITSMVLKLMVLIKFIKG